MIHVLLVMTVSRMLTHKLTSGKAWSPLCGAVSTCKRLGDRVRGIFMTRVYAARLTARQDDEGGGRWTLQEWSVSAAGQRVRRHFGGCWKYSTSRTIANVSRSQ